MNGQFELTFSGLYAASTVKEGKVRLTSSYEEGGTCCHTKMISEMDELCFGVYLAEGKKFIDIKDVFCNNPIASKSIYYSENNK